MRYKPQDKTRRARVHIPRLDGGLNLFDPPSAVADNQLTACTNMWWHRGALRVRPGLVDIGTHAGNYNIVQPIGDDETLFIEYRLDEREIRYFGALLQRADGSVCRFGLAPGEYYPLGHDPAAPFTAFGCHAPQGLDYDFVFYFGGGEIITYTEATEVLAHATPYEPLVLADGTPTVSPQDTAVAGTPLEQPNRLCARGIATYSTDGKGSYFYLPAAYRHASLRMTLTLYDHTSGNQTTVNPAASPAFTAAALGLDTALYTRATVKLDTSVSYEGRFRLYLSATRADGGTEILPVPAVSRNNLQVTMTGHPAYDPLAVCRMTMATWYGGVYGGVYGGTRLFIAGDGDNPRRLLWSQVDNPLYFPARGGADVGDDPTAITALAKQDDRLIVFKEHAVYCADYVGKSDPVVAVAGDLDEWQSASAYFPITTLSTAVGCDCPATVRAVNNRLVWMTAAGKIYMLTAVDIHKNRNVREISALIESALAVHPLEERRAAGGGAYDGRYLLAVGSTVYVLDCRTPAFVRYGQYADEQSALRALVYHRWELPSADRYRVIAGSGTAVLIAVNPTAISAHRLDGHTDGGEPIRASFATRRFGCDDPTRRMSVEAAYLETSDPVRPVRVSFITDAEETPAAVITPAEIPVADRVVPRRLAPVAHRTATCGIRCETEGDYAVGALTILSRINGTIR